MKTLAHLYLCSTEHTQRKRNIEPPWLQEVLFNVYAFDLHDPCVLSSSLSEPRGAQPLGLFSNDSFKINLPSILSSKSSWREAGCMVMVRLKQFTVKTCPQLEPNTEGKIFLQVVCFLGELNESIFSCLDPPIITSEWKKWYWKSLQF